ncbi:MAG: polysaccharide deacetylase family protein [Hyphomicrobium sp.]
MTRIFLVAVAFLVAAPIPFASATEKRCSNPDAALGVSRIVEIDTKAGPLFGDFSKYEREPRFLGPKEVVLTFDDGPMPRYTKPILEALDKFCTKATFFYVGRMATAYPSMVKEVMGRGHTVGSHTWSHPLNLRRRGLARAKDQIERGIAAVELAAGQPIAPFFRFPGLSDSGPLLAYLQSRGIATFTVDVVSNDSYISSPSRLAKRTIAEIERNNGGIVLFHDIKRSTAKALPAILAQLKKRGYKVVHLRTKSQVTPIAGITDQLEKKRDKKQASRKGKPKPVPIYEAIAPSTLAGDDDEPSLTELAPEPRQRVKSSAEAAATAPPQSSISGDDATPVRRTRRTRRSRKRRARKKKVSTASPEVPSTISSAVRGY